jgi:hypothetical protein
MKEKYTCCRLCSSYFLISGLTHSHKGISPQGRFFIRGWEGAEHAAAKLTCCVCPSYEHFPWSAKIDDIATFLSFLLLFFLYVWQVEALLSIASSKFKGVGVCKASSTKRNKYGRFSYSSGTLWHVFALARSFQNPKLFTCSEKGNCWLMAALFARRHLLNSTRRSTRQNDTKKRKKIRLPRYKYKYEVALYWKEYRREL